MAPLSRTVATKAWPNGISNKDRGAFDAPPSTMAAQLISDLSTTNNAPSRQRETEFLKNLMTEVSATEKYIVDHPDIVYSLDQKLEQKHNLIYVLSRAVLETLVNDDPFKDVSQLVGQASEALEIFVVAIKEVPEVLDHVLPADQVFPGRGEEPLWQFLFPKVLALLGRRGCEDLTNKISSLFCASLQGVGRSPKLWNLSSIFFSVLKTSVQIALKSLDTSRMSSVNQGFAITMFLDQDGTASVDAVSNLVYQFTYRVRDISEGYTHTGGLLKVLVDVSISAAESYNATPAFRAYLSWMLDSFIFAYELRKRHSGTLAPPKSGSGTEIMFFRSIHALLSKLRSSLWPAILRKGYTILSIICADLLKDWSELSDQPFQLSVCRGLLSMTDICKEHESMRRVMSLHLMPTIQDMLTDEETFSSLESDMRMTIAALCQSCDVMMPDGIMRSLPSNLESPELLAELRRLHLQNEVVANGASKPGPGIPSDDRPTKRRKLGNKTEIFGEVVADVYELLGKQRATSLTGLSQVVEECFAALDDNSRYDAIELLGRLPCGVSGSLSVRRHDGKVEEARCHICDRTELPNSEKIEAQMSEETVRESILTFTKLIQSTAFLEGKRIRIMAMHTLRRFATHFDNNNFLDLETSPLAQWCILSMKSSLRGLRIAAGRTIPIFLRGIPTPDSLARKNITAVMVVLRQFAEQESVHVQESTVLVWGQIGRIAKDDELNFVLRELVKFLAHSNPIVSGAAIVEILKLARTAEVTVEKLFSPFWSNIAITVVTDLLVKPQTAQTMADLLGISVSEFLVLTQSYTLPFLVLNGATDVIRRIVEARKDESDWLLCLDATNLVPILGLLLVQNVPDLDTFIMGLLKRVSADFKQFDLTDLLRMEPLHLALYLLKIAGEASESTKSRIRFALQFLASRMNENTGSKKSNVVGVFLEQHLLGLVTRIVEVVNDPRDDLTIKEKERSIRAIEELFRMAKTHARAARPQFCACLQSAFAQRELQSSAFSAWDAILRNLGDEDVESMLETTFSLILQNWESFDNTTQEHAEDTVQYLIKFRARLIRNTIVNLPSLAQFSRLADVESQLNKLRTPTDIGNAFQIFRRRLGHENPGVVTQSLVELKTYLRLHQSFLQASAVSEQPDILVGQLTRSILDTCVKYNEWQNDIAVLSAECLGLIGCLDSNRVESVRDTREMVVVSNFHSAGETTDFVLYVLKEVLVPAFLTAEDTSLQGYFSYVMQELLERCDFKAVVGNILQNGTKNSTDDLYVKWLSLPASIQDTLTPFLSSKYSLGGMVMTKYEYPIFRPDRLPPHRLHNAWLRNFALDLLQKPCHFYTDLIYPPLCRAIRIKDVSVANFILPYLVLHIIVDGADKNRAEIGSEMICVLEYEAPSNSQIGREDLKLCIEAVFRILDYLARWIQEKQTKAGANRGQMSPDAEREIKQVKDVIEMIPPELISRRAIECKSYSRALFYWEQHIRDVRGVDTSHETNTAHLQRLQDIYTQIDEPDGIEGISAHLHVLDIDQQILGHRKAGRWTAAQSWYEIQLAERPDDVDVQLNLLTCLKESGQHDVLLNYVEGMHTAAQTVSKLLPYAAEASWVTGRWKALEKYTSLAPPGIGEDFNVKLGRALLALQQQNTDLFKSSLKDLRERIARSLSNATTASLGACRDTMLKLHVLTELEMIAGTDSEGPVQPANVLDSLNRRIEVIGAFLNDKQYLLGIRRAAMQLSSLEFSKGDIASAWLTSARLARKGNAIHQSFNAVLHASQLGDESATIEHARLLWKEGHHRKAIQSLQGAIETNAFISHNKSIQPTSFTGVDKPDHQNLLTARAHLLYAKWLDSAGQTHSNALRTQYQLAAKTHTAWEKGHYYLGRHYNKLLETEKALAPELQNENYLTGETAKLVIENYLRSLTYGTKYIYQTLPRLLTLWLDLGTQAKHELDGKYGNSKEFTTRINGQRKTHLDHIHQRLSKYITKMPAYMFYTALPQIVARIAHSNIEVYKHLQNMIFKVVVAHPQQALWSLLAVCTSTQSDRRTRGGTILQALRNSNSKKSDGGSIDIKALIKNGERLTEQLLMACNAGEFQGNRTTIASLSKDLGFNHKACTPSLLAVPVETVLTATLPTLTDNIRSHKAFSRDIVTVESFEEDVLVLSSLQKPRKLTARGSDGRRYGIMCKPKDDLRKDQRLMEFNSMINRSLKRDAESSRRQLYIKTYAVTPLNEECGLIEWVDGLKTLRDILLGLYKSIGVAPNYREIEIFCDEATKDVAKLPFFTEKVLGKFPPIFHKWFVQQFPEPSTWFVARLRYTRSCAVMSMVGTILGLGDRHGENILFEEGNGGTFHVDFNCLFDKGLTFVKPERVPFRLTHNMIDAMGMYGYEGPFRQSSELTLKLLRQHEETLMTILEAFVYDPTLDLLAKKPERKKKEGSFVIPQTAQGVLDSIQRKVKGLLVGESVPLGVEGQVDELIKQATNQTYLAGMYIGWCSFF